MNPRFDRRPSLPEPRGGLSASVIEAIAGDGELRAPPVLVGAPLDDDDLHLALYVCYELHYGSFAGVGDRWEWDPGLIAFRTELEAAFTQGLDAAVPRREEVEGESLADLLFELAEEDSGPSLSTFLQKEGTIDHFREFVVHRSAYQLKEADPHTWAIPRLRGAPKAAMVEIQADEYGSGRPDRVHSALFAKAMDALGLDSTYGAYLDRIPGITLATVNLISRFGLHRELRGALTGHLAMFEITSPVPNRRYSGALRRFGASDDAIDFFDEHVEADSVHEQVAARDLAQGLALAEPHLAEQIVFGAEALLLLEARWSAALLASWEEGESSLRAQAGSAVSPA